MRYSLPTARRSDPTPQLLGNVEISIDDFVSFKTWQWDNSSNPVQVYPTAGEYVCDVVSNNEGQQSYFLIIHKDSFFGVDQSSLFDALTAAADPLNPVYLYYKGSNLRYDTFRIDSAHYYADTEYYAFVGLSQNLINPGPFPVGSILVSTTGIEYVPPTGSGVNGSFVAGSQVIQVVDGIITSIV